MAPSNPKAKSSLGMTVTDARGEVVCDLVAGLACTLGHRHASVLKAIESACGSHLGDALESLAADWQKQAGDIFSPFAFSHLLPSRNDANELALRIARTAKGKNRYRVITLLGSDHGDTFALRSASGRVQSQGGDGPVAVGFRHVIAGDIDAMKKAIDDPTAAVCMSPVDWNRGGEPFDTDYLDAVGSLCRERDLLLMIDETKVPPGVGGTDFFYQRSSLTPDLLTLSSGWHAGLGGGMTLATEAVIAKLNERDDVDLSWSRQCRDLPLLRSVVLAISHSLANDHRRESVDEVAELWAAMLDDLTGGFDFVKGCVHAGLWTTIELDLPAVEVASSALSNGLRVLATGETTLLICPPIVATGDTLLEAIQPLRQAFEKLESETTPSP